jgi:hypothetical protein
MGEQTCGTPLPLFPLSVVRLTSFKCRHYPNFIQFWNLVAFKVNVRSIKTLFLRLYGVDFQIQLSLQRKQLLCYDIHFKLRIITIIKTSRGSLIGTATSYDLDGLGSIPGRPKIFLFCVTSRPALRPTQPPIQRVLAFLFWE